MLPSRRWFYAAALLGLLFGIGALLDLSPIIRGPTEWRWALAPDRSPTASGIYVASLILFLLGWYALPRWLPPDEQRPYRPLLLLVGLALLVQYGQLNLFRTPAGHILFERLLSNQASGYFTVAQEIEHWPTALRQYDEIMPGFQTSSHARTKPPGIVLTNIGLERFASNYPASSELIGHSLRSIRCADLWAVRLPDEALTANWLLGWITVLLATFTMIPAYFLGRARAGEKAAWLAAGLVALMPGLIAFAPHMDTVYPFLALTALWLVDVGVRRQQLVWNLVAGLLLGTATFLSLVNGMVTILVGLYLLFLLWERQGLRVPELWRSTYLLPGGLLVLGTLFPWIIYGLFFEVWPWEIYIAAEPSRDDQGRSYWLWLPGNLYELFIFTGVPAMFLSLRWPERLDGYRPLFAAFWLSLLLMLLSGAIRGEVGRIWLFMTPFPLLLAAYVWAGQRRVALCLMGIVALSSLAIGLRWEVTQLEWPDPVARAVQVTPRPMVSHNEQFGKDIRLVGHDLEINQGINLQLYWQVEKRPDIPYTVFVHLLDEQGNIAAQQDQMPQQGNLPTTCWQNGELVVDQHLLPLSVPTDQLRVGLYDAVTGDVLNHVLIDLP